MFSEIVRHHENDVNIVRRWLVGDIAAEDDEAFQLPGPLGQFVDTHESGRDKFTLRRAAPKARDHLSERRRMNADG